MKLLENLIIALPFVAVVAFKFSSINWVRRLSWVPALQFLLVASLALVDRQCEGDGFKLSWINCGNLFLDQNANALAGLLYVNLFSILALPPALAALAIAEIVTRKRKK